MVIDIQFMFIDMYVDGSCIVFLWTLVVLLIGPRPKYLSVLCEIFNFVLN